MVCSEVTDEDIRQYHEICKRAGAKPSVPALTARFARPHGFTETVKNTSTDKLKQNRRTDERL